MHAWASVRRLLTAGVDAIIKQMLGKPSATAGGDIQVTREAGIASGLSQRVVISGPELRNTFSLEAFCDALDTPA